MKRGILIFLILFSLTFASASQLSVTLEHPFLINENWISASSLQVGQVLTNIQGQKIKITKIEKIVQDTSVFNIETSVNSYIVDNLIVHNSQRKAVKGFTPESQEALNQQIKSYYAVVDRNDANRFYLSNGRPFPTEPTKAALGKGLYSWESYEDARLYLNRLKLSNPQIKLEVIEVQFPKSCGLDTFRTLDLTSRGDEFVNQWLETHSYLWNDKAAPHNFQHIIRGTALESGGLIVNEHYFSPDAFDMATKIIVPPN